jgi:hemerythrin
MPLMQWNDKLSVGIKQFDTEHQKLIGLVNDLFDGIEAGKGKDVLGRILDGLISYTQTHFANEERYMVEHKYPGLAAHKAEHVALANQVVAVQAKYKAGASAVLTLEVMSFLKGWLLKHIQGTDKQYGPFLNGKGLK